MKSLDSLFPGYKQVENFASDGEYESEEEVCYVTLDLGEIEPSLIPSADSYRLIGLDTATPFLQLQGTIFKGRHDSLLGTEMIFTDDKETHDWKKRSVVHLANTEQRIAFKEVTLIPKASKGKEKATNEDTTSTDITVNFDLPQPEQQASMIDRLTGVAIQPPSRRGPRNRRGAATKTQNSRASTGKAKAKSSRTSEAEPEITHVSRELVVGSAPSAPEEDDAMEDMYMDV